MKQLYLQSGTRNGEIYKTVNEQSRPFSLVNASLESTKTSLQSHLVKIVPFSGIAYSQTIVPGEHFSFMLAAVDQRGFVYLVDFQRNKYNIVARAGVPGSCICFNSTRRNEVFVGLTDKSIHCYNTDNGQIVAKFAGFHKASPIQIQSHPTLSIALSYSHQEAILWDTEKQTRKRLLAGVTEVGLAQVYLI